MRQRDYITTLEDGGFGCTKCPVVSQCRTVAFDHAQLAQCGKCLDPYVVPRVASAGDREAGHGTADGGGDAPDGGLDDAGDGTAFLQELIGADELGSDLGAPVSLSPRALALVRTVFTIHSCTVLCSSSVLSAKQGEHVVSTPVIRGEGFRGLQRVPFRGDNATDDSLWNQEVSSSEQLQVLGGHPWAATGLAHTRGIHACSCSSRTL
jgi:hypothetical protein